MLVGGWVETLHTLPGRIHTKNGNKAKLHATSNHVVYNVLSKCFNWQHTVDSRKSRTTSYNFWSSFLACNVVSTDIIHYIMYEVQENISKHFQRKVSSTNRDIENGCGSRNKMLRSGVLAIFLGVPYTCSSSSLSIDKDKLLLRLTKDASEWAAMWR